MEKIILTVIEKRKNRNIIPLAVTVIFALTVCYVSFEHYQYIYNHDGLFYLNAGKQILFGDGQDVQVPNAPIGGPVIYGALDKIVNDAFLTLKIFSISSSIGIVFCSYYIIRNIFGDKIAILGQLFFVVSPALQSRAILATNELLPIFFVMCSFYFITKKTLNRKDLIISAIFIGIASDIRFQSMIIFVIIIIFLAIRSKNIKKNISDIILVSGVFLLCLVPIIGYNLIMHGTILDSDPSFFMITDDIFQTEESLKQNLYQNESTSTINKLMSIEFLEKYSYNLFFHNPNLIFNFVGNNAISIIPIIPYIGLIPPILGFLEISQVYRNKKIILSALILGSTVLTVILFFGDLKYNFLLIAIIPVVFIGFCKIKDFSKNIIPMILLPPCYLVFISIVSLDRADHLFLVWISISIFSSIFFITIIPKIFSKILHNRKIINALTVIIIISVICSNLIFSYILFEIQLYGHIFTDIQTELKNLFQSSRDRIPIGYELKVIGEVLDNQPDIKNNYVMSNTHIYQYYSGSKNLFAFFEEGNKGDSLNDYVLRKNWAPFDLKYSNTASIPQDRHGKNNPIPNYLVYTPLKEEGVNKNRMNFTQTLDLKILENPEDSRIPKNFQMLYKSNETGTVVYKINWQK